MDTKQYNPSILPHIPTVEEDRLRAEIERLYNELKIARARIKDRDRMLSDLVKRLDRILPNVDS